MTMCVPLSFRLLVKTALRGSYDVNLTIKGRLECGSVSYGVANDKLLVSFFIKTRKGIGGLGNSGSCFVLGQLRDAYSNGAREP